MEADSTSSSFQQKETDDTPSVHDSQMSLSNRGDNSSNIDDNQATQSKVPVKDEENADQTLKSGNQTTSDTSEQTGGDSQNSQREKDVCKEENGSVQSTEMPVENIPQNLPEEVVSVLDNSVKDCVQEEMKTVSEVDIACVNKTACSDIGSMAENKLSSIDQVSSESQPDVSGPSQERQVEADVSSSCNIERLTAGDENNEKVAMHSGKDVTVSVEPGSTVKKDIDENPDETSSSSISKELIRDDILPSDTHKTTSETDEVINEGGKTDQQESPDIQGGEHEQCQESRDDKQVLEDNDENKEASDRERTELDNPTVIGQQVQKATPVTTEVIDEVDLTLESKVQPCNDSKGVDDDKAAERDVTDTGTFDTNKLKENEEIDAARQDTNQEEAEAYEKKCEGKDLEGKEGTDDKGNKEEDTERQEEQREAESTSEQIEAIPSAGDDENGNDKEKDEDHETNGESAKEPADEKETEKMEMGEEDEQDEKEEETNEGKSERRRASPIRCFDESNFTLEKLFEYQWPQDHGEFFFVQEQISEYLGVTSFKRKYPALERRLIAVEERRFLKEKGVVTEEQVTLGLTALKADEVYDVMQKDFPDKYSDYARLIQQRQREAVKNQHKGYGTPAVDSAKMKNYIKKAVKQAAEYNASLMREKREERQYYLDLQTMLVHCPKNKMKKLTRDQSKPGPYPVAIIPGQYQNYYKRYTPEELKYLPVNTAIYGPMATQKQSDIAPNVPPGSEVSSDDEDLSVSSEPQKPSKAEAATKTTTKSSSKTSSKANKNNSKTTEKPSKRVRYFSPQLAGYLVFTPFVFLAWPKTTMSFCFNMVQLHEFTLICVLQSLEPNLLKSFLLPALRL